MGYINFRVGKLKKSGEMSRAQAHNQRTGFCDNTDKTRAFLNQQLMPCVPDYEKFVEERIASSPRYTKVGVRSDAVKMLDLEFRVSAEEMSANPHFDLDEFCRLTKEWVCKTFGEDNVADLVLHMDEGYGVQNGELKCAPHIHALVVPMTKDGRLSASSYIGSPELLRGMQTEVAAQYSSLKLKRGLEKSVATHTEMKEFYGMVHSAREVSLPEPGDRETACQYATRIAPSIRKRQSQDLADKLKLERERDEALTRVRQLEAGQNIDKEAIEKARAELKKREETLRDKESYIKKNMAALTQWQDVLAGLKSSDITEDERKAFLDVAQKALAYRESERAKNNDDAIETPSNKTEIG